MTGYMRVIHLRQTVELGANGLDSLSDADGIVEDRVRRIYLVGAL